MKACTRLDRVIRRQVGTQSERVRLRLLVPEIRGELHGCITDNAKLMRRAVAIGTDIRATMQSIGHRDLWILCDRIYYCGTPFGNDTVVRAGGSRSGDKYGLYFNENDKAKARQMALDAGYAGETITLLNPNDYSTITPVGIVMKQELEQMGFVVEAPNRDWATGRERA